MAALAVCGCQKIETKDAVSDSKPFTATIEAFSENAIDVETKTSLNSTGNILWKQGDQISIFAGSTINEQYQVTDASDGKTAASLYQVTGPGFVAGSEINNNVAFYPYVSTAEIQKNGSAYVIGDFALPATQNYAQASFGNGAFPMAAVTSSKSDYNLKFKNVLGGLKLQLKGTATITSISVTGNNSEKLCGAASVTVSNAGAPVISLTDATAKTVTLDCGDVQLSANTATAFIIALPPMTMTGGFTVTVTDSNDKQMEIKTTKSQTISRSDLLSMPAVTFVAPDPTPVPAGAVDLGLTSGLKWATCNVGASSPEEYGDYFAWGETEPYYTAGHSQDNPCSNWENNKTGYNWASYKWCNGSYDTQTKYCTNSSYGNVDNNTVLDPEDDAAAVNWGGTWRMPTDAEWTELRTECNWTWTTQNGINGYLVTGTNQNSIFLPAAGYRYYTGLDGAASYGSYWSSSLYTGDPDRAWFVDFSSDGVGRYYNDRCNGRSVRAVSE